jgi:hypothetical protein
MGRVWLCLLGAVCLAICATSPAFGQGGTATSSLSGVVVDAGGGVIPGATVVVKNNATGIINTVVTGSTGTFSVPALPIGTYTVTVTLSGFKTFIANNVRLLAGTPGSIKATLEVGELTEVVEVRGGTDIVQTQSATISSTISVEQVSNLPLVSRNALNFVVFLPGVQTPGGPRNSTISGLPEDTINITLDGISVSNNLQSGDGFFSMVVPSMDAIEEVTVTMATQGADAAGQGATQIKFVTRSGTNTLQSSVYHYFRHPSLNSNYYFNKVNGLDKNDVVLHQAGGRIGGPIVIPGLLDGRGKAFFFFNYEQFYQPTEVTNQRTLLTPDAQRGVFTYLTGDDKRRQVDLLALAASRGQVSTPDPTIAAMLARIRSGAQTTGNIVSPPDETILDDYIYQAPATSDRYFPTVRTDFNLTLNHRLSGSYYWQRFVSSPDVLNNREPNFPGLLNFGEQTSYRTSGSLTLRSTLGSNLVNEMRGGWQWSPVEFFTNISAAQFENGGGYRLDFPLGTDPFHTNSPQPRNTTNWSVENTMNWLRGNHSFTFGGVFTQVTHDQNVYTVVPEVEFGVDDDNDPAAAMFTTANFPGASSGELDDARDLYALITGRVDRILGTGRLSAETNRYEYNGALNQKSRMNGFGMFAQDSWRVTPTLTVNYGARWEVVLPFYPITTNWSMSTLTDLCGISGVGSGPGGRQCNLFQPGSIPSPEVRPQYVAYNPGDPGYNTDWNNIAPNVGVAWRPNVQSGWLRGVLGDPEMATVRAGYSVSYNRPRMDEFTGLFGGNPGATVPATRGTGASDFPLVPSGQSWPLLFRDRDRLGPPAFQTEPEFPIIARINSGHDIRIFDPDTEIPLTRSWSVGFQRALSRDMVIEARYVGNRNMRDWTDENWNELVIFENGFLDEFKLAQQNLQANIAAGRGNTFRYFGAGTGTSPLPTYLAFFSGVPFSDAGDASRYTSSLFRNSSWLGHLERFDPDPRDAANDLWNNSGRRANALSADVPLNYFVMNPHVDDAFINVARAGSKYHSFQLEARRRMSRGLTLQGSYTFAQIWGSSNQTLRRDRIFLKDDGVPHAFKGTWVYDIPVGRGRRFGTDLGPILNGVLGNWEFSGTARVQVRDLVLNNARLVGMTQDELNEVFDIRITRDPLTGDTFVFNAPEDIIDNTRRAYDTSATSPTGYGDDGPPTGRYIAPASTGDCIFLYVGDCGQEQIRVKGPWFTRVDVRFKKQFPFGQRGSFELDIEILNALDSINFNPAFSPNPNDSANIFRVQSAYTDINTTQDPGGRLGQIVWRINF